MTFADDCSGLKGCAGSVKAVTLRGAPRPATQSPQAIEVARMGWTGRAPAPKVLTAAGV